MELSPFVQEQMDRIAAMPQRTRVAAIVLALIAIGGGYYMGSYRADQATIAALKTHELGLQRKLSEVRSVAANLKVFEQEIVDLESEFALALRQLPDDKELEVLLTDINNLGKTSGVEIKFFERGQESMKNFYAEVPIDLEIEGEFHDVARFFDLLAHLPRIVNVDSLEMSIISESAELTRLKVSGIATTFRFVEDRKVAVRRAGARDA
ncbi:type 4a pilus biogenesis protein PilO [Myxococcota bacterium]|nr:type 4a pilus biogenesis protein PilO [Myxococcota bacterium]